MSDQPKTCPKCKQPMELGFVLEQNLSNYCPSVWVEGSPEPSFWTVTKVSGKTKRVVETHRCVGCGYLESYATHEWAGAMHEWAGKVNPE